MAEKFQPDAEYVVDDLETLKVLTDPLRLRILEAASSTPTTVKRISERLGVAQKKLYYHVNLLEERGLIVVVDTQIVSGIVEKWYQARARSFVVDKMLCCAVPGDADSFANLSAMLTAAFDATRADILKAAQWGMVASDENQCECLLIQKGNLAFLPGEHAEFIRRLKALLDEYRFDQSPGPDDTHEAVGCLIVVYPAALSPGDEGDNAEPEEK